MNKQNIPNDWQYLLDEYNNRLSNSRKMGGEEKLNKRAASGKRNARELIQLFTDQDSFSEVGTLVGSLSYHGEKTANADALIGGTASIDGLSIVICVEDFTVQGGSIGHGTNAKRVRLANIALKRNLPFVMLLDGAGARMSNAMTRHPYGPNDLQIISQLSGVVPTAAIVIGSSAGHGAVGGLLMDFIIMLKDSAMFAAGPPLVAAATGELVSKEELGGADMHTRISGVAHNIANTEEDAADMLRDYLTLICQQQNETKMCNGANLLRLIPANAMTPYNVRPVIDAIVDEGTFLEIQADYAKAIVTGIARIAGKTVAIIANQPAVLAGSIDVLAANKAADFINTYNVHGLAFLFLADTPGIMSGSAAEKTGTLRAAAKMYKAQSDIRGIKIHVTLRKAFGFGSCVMGMNPFDNQTATYALPGISLGGMPVSGGAEAANLDQETARKLQEAEQSGAWVAGDALAYDEIIDPRDLRSKLEQAIT
ncbi:MAG: carboxyl transferase [Pseudomonadales bacterium]|nr:carboxyl transferase [Pseudomonadales bacterium]